MLSRHGVRRTRGHAYPSERVADLLTDLRQVRQVADVSPVPVAAYNVSGEYSMVETAAAAGLLDRRAVIVETLTAIRRAGADVVLTYWATEAAAWLG